MPTSREQRKKTEGAFFYIKDGRREDEDLHTPIIEQGDHKTAFSISRKVAKGIGLTDAEIDLIMGPEVKMKDFDESKHPRDPAGKFSEGGGGTEDGSSNGIDKTEKLTSEELKAAKADVEGDFPDIKNYSIIGKPTQEFNCAADAVGDHEGGWWWPGAGPAYHWPKEEDAPSEEAFDRLFVDDLHAERVMPEAPNAEAPEKGFVKLALFEDAAADPTHLTRLMDNGHWVSKMGASYKVEHDKLHRLDGQLYGHPAVIYKMKTEEWRKLRDM